MQVVRIEIHAESTFLSFQRLKLECQKLLSAFAFHFKLRRYSKGMDYIALKVGRCRLTVSKPVLKAPMLLTLESGISYTAFNVCYQFQVAPLHVGQP